MMVDQLITCPGDITFMSSGGLIAKCSTDWAVVTSADVITAGLNSSLPTPESLVLAFGAGVAVMVPLYGVLWGIRAARESINKS
tara:strand:- start:312 stop:563 length:252 start_codon:yes stop_codon:yes gene_type:complete